MAQSSFKGSRVNEPVGAYEECGVRDRGAKPYATVALFWNADRPSRGLAGLFDLESTCHAVTRVDSSRGNLLTEL